MECLTAAIYKTLSGARSEAASLLITAFIKGGVFRASGRLSHNFKNSNFPTQAKFGRARLFRQCESRWRSLRWFATANANQRSFAGPAQNQLLTSSRYHSTVPSNLLQRETFSESPCSWRRKRDYSRYMTSGSSLPDSPLDPKIMNNDS